MIITQLILAHLIGDFILQPNKWVAHKETHKTRSTYLYLHTGVHFLLALLLLWNLKLWWLAVLAAVSHLAVDALKLHFQKPETKRIWFFADQALHLIILMWIAGLAGALDFSFLQHPQTIKYITAAVFLTIPSSIIIKTLLSTWSPVTVEHSKLQTDSLTNAGQYIGYLERLLVFTFIIVNHWEGVGFMIAAKSVFRFSDLAEAKQRKLTEYVLIGTLLSFGIAVLAGILVMIS